MGECTKTRVYFFNYVSLFRVWKIHDEIRAYSSVSVSQNKWGERWSGLPGILTTERKLRGIGPIILLSVWR